MSTPILTTKLYVPSTRPGVIGRSRLMQRLDSGRSGRLTLLSPPPVPTQPVLTTLLNFGKAHEAKRPIDDAERLIAEGKTAVRVIANRAEFSALPAALATTNGYYAQAMGDVSGMVEHARRSPAQ